MGLSGARVISIDKKIWFCNIFFSKDSLSLESQYLMNKSMKFVEALNCSEFL